MKMKLSFLVLFLVMHSQNALSIDFEIDLDVDPRPERTCQCCHHVLMYNSDTDSFDYNDGCFCCSFEDVVKQLSEVVIRPIVRDMLGAPVTFSEESLPRNTELNHRMVNIANGGTLQYSFQINQTFDSVIEDRRYPDVPVQIYVATFSIQGSSFVYAIVGQEVLPEPQDEDAVAQAPDEGLVEEEPDENPIEPTTSNFGNTPDTLPELNPSCWERLANPFMNLLFQQNSR
ncbi:hypothetical protein [Endozoicomonas euniceicola]|uniref:Uncharacterized protein n=1 Tax=Endozoicomonas euniceicola TaxID=1234143 RepID=A0ABY6GRF5_9GAMM|nr:hypothetical protein [Endozoicomonas euniceicola]UYM15336.1 hypothetical protein NX720_21160 [Endozoicomonas euniceicola]